MSRIKFLFVLIGLALILVLGVVSFNTSTSSGNGSSTYLPEADTTAIFLKGTTAEFIGKNVNIVKNSYYGTIVEITGSGIYVIQGSLNRGFISVSKKGLDVTIILNGANIISRNYAALTSLEKSNVTVVLAENTTNSLLDGSNDGSASNKYYHTYNNKKHPNATLLVRGYLTIKGSGKLMVSSKYHNGIRSRAKLKIEDGEIEINAAKNAVKGNNAIVISGGIFNIVSGNDGIQASTTLTINNGVFNIDSGDDAIRAQNRLTINGGNINITKCYEGLEAHDIDLNGGFVKIKSSDDGINVSGGWRVGDVEEVIDGTLTITGGEYYVEAGGDAVDSNGHILMSGGTVVAFGPTDTSSTDRSVDFDRTFIVTGGLLLGLGYTTDKMQAPALSDSAQHAFLAEIATVPAGSLINVSSDSGTEVLTIKTLGSTRSLLVSSHLLGKGVYKISAGGTHSGSANAMGLYEGGVYSGSSVVASVFARIY